MVGVIPSSLSVMAGDTGAVSRTPSSTPAANAPFAYGVQQSLGVPLISSGPSSSSSHAEATHAGAIAGHVHTLPYEPYRPYNLVLLELFEGSCCLLASLQKVTTLPYKQSHLQA
jgi:hypothetical protein